MKNEGITFDADGKPLKDGNPVTEQADLDLINNKIAADNLVDEVNFNLKKESYELGFDPDVHKGKIQNINDEFARRKVKTNKEGEIDYENMSNSQIDKSIKEENKAKDRRIKENMDDPTYNYRKDPKFQGIKDKYGDSIENLDNIEDKIIEKSMN